MAEYLHSFEFWFGAVLLLASQVAKFYELNSFDPVFGERSTLIPNLRADDFAGPRAFRGMLFAFLAITFLVYLVLCAASPTLLTGWAEVTDAVGDPNKYSESVPFPLYIAAALMGLTQPIPGWTTIANLQRNIFHFWIGVPKKVVETAMYLSNQVRDRAHSSGTLNAEVEKLTSDAWVRRIDPYADTVFYRQQIERMELDKEAELKEVLSGSNREKKGIIEQLIYAASVATVRESGGKALPRLAEHLDVEMPPAPPSPRDLGAGALLFIVALTVLWFLIPMLDSFVEQIAGARPRDFWPNTLGLSGQYILSQVVPIFLSVTVMLSMWSSSILTTNDQDTPVEGAFNRYASLLLAVVIIVITYDYVQAIFDTGYFRRDFTGSTAEFFLTRLPFNVLHSLIAASACFVILLHIGKNGATASKTEVAASGALLAVVVALVSSFYSEARLLYQYDMKGGLDFVALVVLLNVLSALLAFAAAIFYFRRRIAATRPRRGQLAHPQTPNLVPVVNAGGLFEQ